MRLDYFVNRLKNYNDKSETSSSNKENYETSKGSKDKVKV